MFDQQIQIHKYVLRYLRIVIPKLSRITYHYYYAVQTNLDKK